MSQDARRDRANVRRRIAVLHKTRLQVAEKDLSPIQGTEALSLVTRLTIDSWSLGGLELPDYGRAETPYRFLPSSGT